MKRYGLACFVLLGLLGHAGNSLLLADPPPVVRVGFERDRDLFECLPGDKVRLEETKGAAAMRWEVNYVNKQYRVCVKEIESGTASGMTTMSLRLRADSRHQLWLQINEKSGEKFYRIVTAELKWRELSLGLADFELNEDKVVNGRLDVDQITRIVLLPLSSLKCNL